MPGYGPAQGKGDAMWRSLSVARGDIVMFADADTRDFDEHFVYGTLGPLLTLTRHPVHQGAPTGGRSRRASESVADGGGRVTELMAKPLLNLFYPELAGFVQPLAGEFAARRDLLASAAVPDRLRRGDRACSSTCSARSAWPRMAQVDLGTRQNRHQPLCQT